MINNRTNFLLRSNCKRILKEIVQFEDLAFSASDRPDEKFLMIKNYFYVWFRHYLIILYI